MEIGMTLRKQVYGEPEFEVVKVSEDQKTIRVRSMTFIPNGMDRIREPGNPDTDIIKGGSWVPNQQGKVSTVNRTPSGMYWGSVENRYF